MRTRDWRRYKLELIVRKRLKKFHSASWYRYQTPNGDKLQNYEWCDEIGSTDSFCYKSHSTARSSRYEIKYSPNKSRSYYGDIKPRKDSLGTRLLDKREFLKILKQYGLR
jgi:hypothetical protein